MLHVKLHYIIRFEFDIRFDIHLEFVFDSKLEIFVRIRFELKKSYLHTLNFFIIYLHCITLCGMSCESFLSFLKTSYPDVVLCEFMHSSDTWVEPARTSIVVVYWPN